MTRQVDELARHVRRLGNHELNELLLELPKPLFAARVAVAGQGAQPPARRTGHHRPAIHAGSGLEPHDHPTDQHWPG